MNVCSPIALNAISSENELIVYIEMMRTGGQTKTGTKRKRRKKRSGISIRWDRKESKIDECRSNQRACARTWTQQTRKKRPSTSLEMVFGGKKTHHQIGVCTHWKCEHSQIETVIFQVFQSIRYLTWIIFTISQWVEQKKCSVFHNELPSQPLEKRERKKYLEQKSSNVKWLRGCWFEHQPRKYLELISARLIPINYWISTFGAPCGDDDVKLFELIFISLLSRSICINCWPENHRVSVPVQKILILAWAVHYGKKKKLYTYTYGWYMLCPIREWRKKNWN